MDNGMLVCKTLQLQKGILKRYIYVTAVIVGEETLLMLN